MRVGDKSLYLEVLAGLARGQEGRSRALAGIADGKRVRRASDDPVQAPVALALRARLVAISGYDRSTSAARTDLQAVESALGEVVSILSSARAEAMAGASGASDAGNNARAARVEALRDQLLALANTSQGGRYLFAGTATLAPPFGTDGTYAGTDAETDAPLDAGESVGATVSGRRAFLQGGDLFARLDALAQALRDGRGPDAAIAAAALRGDGERVSDVRAEIGARIETIEAALVRHGDEAVRLSGRLSEIEDADLAATATEFQAAETAHEALSAAAARVLGRSLFDYLG